MQRLVEIGFVRRAAVAVLSALVLSACFSGMEEGEQAGGEQVGEVSLAQDNAPTTGGSCTIDTCAGTKDPFGKYECTENGCSCVRGTTRAPCDSSGCKEGNCPPKDADISTGSGPGGVLGGYEGADQAVDEPVISKPTLGRSLTGALKAAP